MGAMLHSGWLGWPLRGREPGPSPHLVQQGQWGLPLCGREPGPSPPLMQCGWCVLNKWPFPPLMQGRGGLPLWSTSSPPM